MLVGWVLLMVGVMFGQFVLMYVAKPNKTLILPSIATALYVGMLTFGWDFGAFATALLILSVTLWILSIWRFFK